MKLGTAGARIEELKTALQRLAPLAKEPVDSCAVLRDWLKLWPDDATDPVRAAVVRGPDVSAALDKLDETVRNSLGRVTVGLLSAEAQAHLDTLRGLLSAGEQERPLTGKAILKWNDTGRELLHRVLEQLPPNPPPPPPPPPPYREGDGGGPTPPQTRTVNTALVASDTAKREVLLGRIRSELDALGDAQVDVAITITPRATDS